MDGLESHDLDETVKELSEYREIKKSKVLAPRWPIFFTGGNVE